ncbi:MAG: hypothetical protein IIA70_04585 [Proteobacteria bacterium]|nr:hypothetical protein [Pseudomonadota bacterium]
MKKTFGKNLTIKINVGGGAPISDESVRLIFEALEKALQDAREPIRQLFGWFGEWASERRALGKSLRAIDYPVRKLEREVRSVNRINQLLDLARVGELRFPTDKFINIAKEAISQEDDPHIQEMLAQLAAKAYDPNEPYPEDMYADILRQFSPLAARIFLLIYGPDGSISTYVGVSRPQLVIALRDAFKADSETIMVHLEKLINLGCLYHSGGELTDYGGKLVFHDKKTLSNKWEEGPKLPDELFQIKIHSTAIGRGLYTAATALKKGKSKSKKP